MKLKMLLASILISYSTLFAKPAQVNMANENMFSINKAFEKSQAQGKPIFYIVASANCGHCVDYLNNTVRTNFEVLNRDFVFAISDLTKGDSIPKGLPFDGTTPTTYILNPNGELMLSPLKGNFSSDYLHEILNKLYKAYAGN